MATLRDSITMQQHFLSLEPLSLPDVAARELVEIAGKVGFDYVSMFLNSPMSRLPADAVVTEASQRREIASNMRKLGVQLLNMECFNLSADCRLEDFAPAFACGYELGAVTASVIVLDNADRADVLAKFQWLCDMAREMNIRVNIEFTALTASMNTLDAAVELVRDSRRANAGIVIDILHLIRTGSSVEALSAIDADLIGAFQISDGPLRRDESEWHYEAASNREIPGTGQFPLSSFLAAMPPHAIVGCEVPMAALAGRFNPEQRARMLFDAMRTL